MTRPTQRKSPLAEATLGRRIRRRLRLSGWSILAERVARAFWPLAALTGIFLAVALMGLLPWLGPTGHLAALWIAGLGALGLAAWGLWRLRRPTDHEAMARLDGEGTGAPIATLTDSIAVGREHEFARTLWISHRRRAQQAAERLRVAPPDLRLAPHDRWALRLLAVVLIAGAVIGAGPDWRATLLASFEPASAATAAAAPEREPVVEAWAVPPVHTGLDTVYLTGLSGGREAVRLPQGTAITIRVSDAPGDLALAGDALVLENGFRALADGLDEAQGQLSGSGSIEVTADGDSLARWRIEMLGDTPPIINFVDVPVSTVTGALELSFDASDDWGIVAAWAEIRAPELEDAEIEPLAEPIDFPLPLPLTGRTADVAETAVRDLSAHPWAGGEVEITLKAEDGAGQVGASGTLTIILPGRDFRNPMARALVEQRRNLALRPDRADHVLDALQAVTRRPETWLTDTQTGAFLAIRIAIRRLAVAVVDETVQTEGPGVMELLWRAALELEDGDLADALERMRQAEQALREALERGASDEEIAALMDELRQAMNDYLSEMMRQALEEGREPPDPSQMQGEQEFITQQELEQMLQELEEAMRSGDRERAEELLSELQRMMENMEAGTPQGGGEGQETMEALQEMIQRQRDLSDRTFDEMRRERRQGQQGLEGQEGGSQEGDNSGDSQAGGQGQGEGAEGGTGQGSESGPQGGPGDLAARQEALRRALEGLGAQIPPDIGQGADQALGEAGRAMGDARDALTEGDLAGALQSQMEALDALSESLDALQEALAGQGQGDPTAGQRRGEGRGGDEDRADPFDRPTGTFGSIDGRATQVPDRSAVDRARRLLEELRRRSAEPDRPQQELEYYDRLMNPF